MKHEDKRERKEELARTRSRTRKSNFICQPDLPTFLLNYRASSYIRFARSEAWSKHTLPRVTPFILRNDTLLFFYFPPSEWTMLSEVAASTAASGAAIKRKAKRRRRKDEKVAPPTIFYSREKRVVLLARPCKAMRIIIARLLLRYTLVLRDRYEYLYYSTRVFVTLHFSSTMSLTIPRKEKKNVAFE